MLFSSARLISFTPLRGADHLAAEKLACNAIEDALAGAEGRRVNLDLGYLDHNKVVLASTKRRVKKSICATASTPTLSADLRRGGISLPLDVSRFQGWPI